MPTLKLPPKALSLLYALSPIAVNYCFEKIVTHANYENNGLAKSPFYLCA